MTGTTLAELTVESRDGDWGFSEESEHSRRFAVIRGTDFSDVRLGRTGDVPRRFLPDRTSARRTLMAGDILIETAGGSPKSPTGRTMLVTDAVLDGFREPVSCASFARFIRVDRRKADPGYVQRALQNLWANGTLESYQVQHTGVARFQYTTFSTTHRFEFPTLNEQQAIAQVLGALDDKIAANTALAGSIDRYLGSLLEQMIGGAREHRPLSEVAAVNAGSVKPSAAGTIRYVDIAAVGVGAFDYPEPMPWADAPGRARRKLRRGDTIWSTVRPNRRSHALNLAVDPLLVASTGLAVLSPTNVGFAFLYEATRRDSFTAYLENVAEGSTYPAVRADRFLEAPVPALSTESIERFESVAAPLREAVFSASEENRTLAATRDALLPQLMSGKLRVREAERIAAEAGA